MKSLRAHTFNFLASVCSIVASSAFAAPTLKSPTLESLSLGEATSDGSTESTGDELSLSGAKELIPGLDFEAERAYKFNDKTYHRSVGLRGRIYQACVKGFTVKIRKVGKDIGITMVSKKFSATVDGTPKDETGAECVKRVSDNAAGTSGAAVTCSTNAADPNYCVNLSDLDGSSIDLNYSRVPEGTLVYAYSSPDKDNARPAKSTIKAVNPDAKSASDDDNEDEDDDSDDDRSTEDRIVIKFMSGAKRRDLRDEKKKAEAAAKLEELRKSICVDCVKDEDSFTEMEAKIKALASASGATDEDKEAAKKAEADLLKKKRTAFEAGINSATTPESLAEIEESLSTMAEEACSAWDPEDKDSEVADPMDSPRTYASLFNQVATQYAKMSSSGNPAGSTDMPLMQGTAAALTPLSPHQQLVRSQGLMTAASRTLVRAHTTLRSCLKPADLRALEITNMEVGAAQCQQLAQAAPQSPGLALQCTEQLMRVLEAARTQACFANQTSTSPLANAFLPTAASPDQQQQETCARVDQLAQQTLMLNQQFRQLTQQLALQGGQQQDPALNPFGSNGTQSLPGLGTPGMNPNAAELHALQQQLATQRQLQSSLPVSPFLNPVGAAATAAPSGNTNAATLPTSVPNPALQVPTPQAIAPAPVSTLGLPTGTLGW